MVFTQQSLLNKDFEHTCYFLMFILKHRDTVALLSPSEQHWMCRVMLAAVKTLKDLERMDLLPVFGFVLEHCSEEDLDDLGQTFSDSLIIKTEPKPQNTSDLVQQWQKKDRVSPSEEDPLFSLASPSPFFLTPPRAPLSPHTLSLLHSVVSAPQASPVTSLHLLLSAMLPDARGLEQTVLLMPVFPVFRSLSADLTQIGAIPGIPQNAVILLCEWFLLNESILHSSPPIPHNFTLREATTLLQTIPSCSSLLSFFKQYLLLCELSDEEGFDVNRCVSDREYRHGVLLRAITSRNERRNELAFACLDGSAEENGEYLRAYLQSVLTSVCSKCG